MTPIDVHDVTVAQLRILDALAAVHDRDGRATVRSVARCAGLGVATTHLRLVQLRALGLVRWEPGRIGTLRPAVRVVAVYP